MVTSKLQTNIWRLSKTPRSQDPNQHTRHCHALKYAKSWNYWPTNQGLWLSGLGLSSQHNIVNAGWKSTPIMWQKNRASDRLDRLRSPHFHSWSMKTSIPELLFLCSNVHRVRIFTSKKDDIIDTTFKLRGIHWLQSLGPHWLSTWYAWVKHIRNRIGIDTTSSWCNFHKRCQF